MVGYRFGKVLPYYAHASAKGAGSSSPRRPRWPKYRP
jgi:hypothetical protein